MEKHTEINEKICQIYLTAPDKAKDFLNNDNNIFFLDLTYKEGRAFEFCCLNKKRNYMDYIYDLVIWAKKYNQEQNITTINKSNTLISAVNSNKVTLIKYLLTSDDFLEHADITYANYGAFFNSVKHTTEKEKTLNYFIDDYKIEKTKEFEKLLKKNKHSDLISRINARDLSFSLNQNTHTKIQQKK